MTPRIVSCLAALAAVSSALAFQAGVVGRLPVAHSPASAGVRSFPFRPARTGLRVAQAGDEFNGGTNSSMDYNENAEATRIRNAYADWCRNYGKQFDESRLGVFSTNFLRMEKYAQQTGEAVRFNEFADLTTEEYRYMLQQQQQQRKSTNANTYRDSDEGYYEDDYGMIEADSQGSETTRAFLTYAKTGFVGMVIGTICVLPASAFHYFVFEDFSYTTYAQWEWDLIASAVQAGLFSTVFRYAIRRDFENETLASRVVWAFVICKALIRVHVTPDCAAYQWLYCAEPYFLLNEGMAATLVMNFVEAVTQFFPTANIMKRLLQNEKIEPYDG